MSCLRCHRDVDPNASYCPACGAPQYGESGPAWTRRRLTRIPGDGTIAGVCAGIADYLDVDVTLVRALWLALSIVPGAVIGGVIAYVLAWMVMPIGARTVVAGRRLTRNTADAKLGGVCAGLADYLGVDVTPIRVLWIVLSVLPGAVVGGALAYIAAWFIVPRRPDAVLSTSATHAA